MDNERKAFDEAVANMTMAKSPYYYEYVFYMHLLSQCRVVFRKDIQAAAGVSFHHDHYRLSLNPEDIEGVDKDGNKVVIQGFNAGMPLKQRIGILKHEMLHIALNHVGRFKLHVDPTMDLDGPIDNELMQKFNKFNLAADCALDQEITRDHLPDYAIYPDNFPNPKANNNWGESTEFYYELLKNTDMSGMGGNTKIAGMGSLPGNGDEKGEGSTPGQGMQHIGVDDHSIWMESEGDSTLQTEMTKRMVERAGSETQKSKGKLPNSYGQMIEGLTINREVDWKQVLRRVVGNKKANSKRTLLRRDRRQPHANWIKGRIKDRIFELGVVSDVSGSVGDSALVELWGSILDICDTYKTPVTMVQVDTEPTDPEELTRQSKIIERKACGGTLLAPAIQRFKEHRVHYDALVVTTDGYLFEDDIEPFAALRVPVIWLIESGGQVMPEMNNGQMMAIQLKNEDK